MHYDKRSTYARGSTNFVADTVSWARHDWRVLGSADILSALRRLKDEGEVTNAQLGRLLELPSSRIAEIYDGKRKVTVDEAKVIVEHFGLSNGAPAPAVEAGVDLVGIPMIDLAYGMGATYTDGHVEVDVLHFPKVWVEAITYSPPELLTWARGRGDSMAPTIHDGDLVLLDRSQRRVTEQDALWAYTVGDLGAIKRLRLKGDRMVILSDNPNVPPDEEPIETINIVARVVFIGKRS
jgi:hypothetical protein